MIFHDKYELLAVHGGDQEIALPGREVSSGRDVRVYLLAAGYTPENRELLATIDELSAEQRQSVLDKGDHEGIPYVVTAVLPGNAKLREWVTTAKSAFTPAQPPSLEQRGAWKVPAFAKSPAPVRGLQAVQDEVPTVLMTAPALRQEAPPAQPPPPPPAAAEPEPGEFTRLLRASAPPEAAPPAAEPGEFTRLFQAPTSAPPATATPQPPGAPASPPVPTVAIPVAAPLPAPPPAGEPGEFTRLFQAPTSALPPTATPQPSGAPASPPAPAAAIPVAPPLPAPPPAGEPGEFTRLFQAPTSAPPPTATPQPSSVPPPPPSQPSRPAGPGEFTRMMQSPLAPEPLRPQPKISPLPGASEFDRMMQADQFEPPPAREVPSSPPPPPGRLMQEPGEFTRMFDSNLGRPDNSAPPPAPLPQGGAATGAFSRHAAPASPQAPAGPSEFTQMFSARPPVSAAKTPAPAPAPAPLSAAPKTVRSYLPLVLILSGLFLLVVLVIVVVVLTR